MCKQARTEVEDSMKALHLHQHFEDHDDELVDPVHVQGRPAEPKL